MDRVTLRKASIPMRARSSVDKSIGLLSPASLAVRLVFIGLFPYVGTGAGNLSPREGHHA